MSVLAFRVVILQNRGSPEVVRSWTRDFRGKWLFILWSFPPRWNMPAYTIHGLYYDICSLILRICRSHCDERSLVEELYQHKIFRKWVHCPMTRMITRRSIQSTVSFLLLRIMTPPPMWVLIFEWYWYFWPCPLVILFDYSSCYYDSNVQCYGLNPYLVYINLPLVYFETSD